jgi:porphobilinogen deaminase
MATLNAGCRNAVGVYAGIDTNMSDGKLSMQAQIYSLDGRHMLQKSRRGDGRDGSALGVELAEECLRSGAPELMRQPSGP